MTNLHGERNAVRSRISAYAVLGLMLALSILCGCDDVAKQFGYIPVPKTDPPKPIQRQTVVHHFDPIAKSEGSLAVDTATGQMCKTWDWVCAKPTWKNPFTGKWEDASRYGITCAAIEAMPTCEQLSRAD